MTDDHEDIGATEAYDTLFDDDTPVEPAEHVTDGQAPGGGK